MSGIKIFLDTYTSALVTAVVAKVLFTATFWVAGLCASVNTEVINQKLLQMLN